MDPKVWSKLITHHRRGHGVDVEALRHQCPLRTSSEKGPKMGSIGYRRLRWWKSSFVAPLEVFGGICVYIGGRSRSGGHRGAHKKGGAPRCLLTYTPSLPGVFWSKKNHREGFIPFGLRLVFLFCETQK